MEGHLTACGSCRERYRKMQLAERVAAVGPEGDLDAPAPFEVERIAQDLGLTDPPRRPLSLLGLRTFGAAASVALAVAVAAIFLRPPDDGLVARGGAPTGISFSAYAVSQVRQVRPLAGGDQVFPADYLKLRATWAGDVGAIHGVEVVLVDAAGRVEHAHLEAPPPAASASVPGAVSFAGMAPGALTTYVIAAPDFELERVRRLVTARAPPDEVAAALDEGAVVEQLELVVGGSMK